MPNCQVRDYEYIKSAQTKYIYNENAQEKGNN